MNVLDLKPGIYTNIPSEDYHARIPGLVNKTGLDAFDRSPATYKDWLGGRDQRETPAMAFGKALHAAILETELFKRTYAVQPDFGDLRFKEPKAARERWLSVNGGKLPLKFEEMQAIEGIYNAIVAHPLAGKMIRNGVAEATVRWTDEATGLECKARSDYYVESLSACFDIKTTDDARPKEFARSVVNYGYDRQHGFYAEGYRAVGRPLQHFVFIACEKSPPYNIALYTLEDRAVARGYGSIRRNLDDMRACFEKDAWPGYETSIQTLELPAWAY